MTTFSALDAPPASSPTPFPASTPLAHPSGRPLHLLTLLRFVAAFWVIVFHLQDMFRLPLPGPLLPLVSNGAYAMSLFFILSGTVLAYSYYGLRQTPRELSQFYVARFARIYPAYFVVHVVGLFLLPVATSDTFRWSFIHATSLLGVQAWFPMANTGVNSGTWSISCEFFFYFLFPALLPLVRGLDAAGRQRTLAYLALFVGFLGLADFAFSRHATFPLTYISPLFRVPEFIIGMVIGVALHQSPRASTTKARTVLFAAALLTLLSCNPVYRVGLWTRANLLIVPAIAWLIYCVASYELARPQAFAYRGWRLSEYLGRASYCMFLVQMPILLWIGPAVKARHPLALAMAQAPEWAFAGTPAAILVLGILAHEFIEKPARRSILAWWSRRATPRSATFLPSQKVPAPAATTAPVLS